MYLAQSSNTVGIQAPFYIDMLEGILSNENQDKKDNIDFAIKQAKQIANNELDVFAINNKYYYFITTLLENYKVGLLKLEIEDINHETYREILDILK